MKQMWVRGLVVVAFCGAMAGCGDDGETTKSTGVDTSAGPSSGNGGASNPGQLQFSASSLASAEGAGSATITVTRTGGSDGAVSVSVRSANQSATAPDDYGAIDLTVTFAAGDTAAKPVTMSIVNDTVDESDETLSLTLSDPTGGAALGSTRQLVVTITDDDISAPRTAPRAAISAQYEQLRIDWTAVADATSYRVLKDPTGSAGFVQVGADLPASARFANIDVVVHTEDWANALYAIAACNAAGCAQSQSMSAQGMSAPLIGFIKASNSGVYDQFGHAVALSADGNTLAVGTIGDDGGGAAIASGAVYVYTRAGSTWSAPAYLKASNAQSSDQFGMDVSLSADGTLLAISAPTRESSRGAVYIFTYDGSAWRETAYLVAPDGVGGDYFGQSVSLNAEGTLIVVGAPYRDAGATFSAGAAYVFSRSGQTWSYADTLTQPTLSSYSYFGSDVSVAGTVAAARVAIGAPSEDVVAGEPATTFSGAGVAYVFTLQNSAWTSARLTSADPDYYMSYGAAVRLSADASTLAVGESQVAHVLSRTGAAWEEQAQLRPTNTQNYFFGEALAISADGNTIALGDYYDAGSASGVDVAYDAAAPDSGAAYVFTRSGTTWSSGKYIKASNTQFGDFFGWSLALNGNGSTLVVGAIYEDSGATTFNGNQVDDCGTTATVQCVEDSGAVYVYQ